MTMTPEQAAEVLRKYIEWKQEMPVLHPDHLELNAALDTAIECMSAATPNDEQIGKLFDQHTDVSVLLNPISPTHAMTRTAAVRFAREVIAMCQFK